MFCYKISYKTEMVWTTGVYYGAITRQNWIINNTLALLENKKYRTPCVVLFYLSILEWRPAAMMVEKSARIFPGLNTHFPLWPVSVVTPVMPVPVSPALRGRCERQQEHNTLYQWYRQAAHYWLIILAQWLAWRHWWLLHLVSRGNRAQMLPCAWSYWLIVIGLSSPSLQPVDVCLSSRTLTLAQRSACTLKVTSQAAVSISSHRTVPVASRATMSSSLALCAPLHACLCRMYGVCGVYLCGNWAKIGQRVL